MIKFYWDSGAYCDSTDMSNLSELMAQYGHPDRITIGGEHAPVIYKDDSIAMGFIAESGNTSAFRHYKAQRARDDAEFDTRHHIS